MNYQLLVILNKVDLFARIDLKIEVMKNVRQVGLKLCQY